MKFFVKIWQVCLLMLLLWTPAASAQVKKDVKAKAETVYIYGVGMNFADSTIYFTAVQSLDNVAIDRAQGYLLNRYAYSEQLNQYIYAQFGKNHETCSVFFAPTRAKAEKKYLRIRRRVAKKYGPHNIVELPADAFQFEPVPFVERTPQK